jgi:lipoate-protein ligase A
VDNFDVKNWYIWPCQELPGDYNMSIDHLLAREYGNLLDKPILRFFTWNPYCISLGYHQKATDISLEQCIRNGIDLVRRPTGGRAILHAEELTYSVIYPFNDLDISDFYKLIHEPFVVILNQMGIPASFEAVQADFRSIYKTDRSYLCFATSAKHEVEIDGKKLIGSAQRIYENSILQHGSVLIGPYHEEIIEYLTLKDINKSKMKQYIREHTSFLKLYQNSISEESLAERVTDQFKKMFNINFTIYDNNSFMKRLVESHTIGKHFSLYSI